MITPGPDQVVYRCNHCDVPNVLHRPDVRLVQDAAEERKKHRARESELSSALEQNRALREALVSLAKEGRHLDHFLATALGPKKSLPAAGAAGRALYNWRERLREAMARHAITLPTRVYLEDQPKASVRSRDCICSDPFPHFCPPGQGEEGFYACSPEEFPPKRADEVVANCPYPKLHHQPCDCAGMGGAR